MASHAWDIFSIPCVVGFFDFFADNLIFIQLSEFNPSLLSWFVAVEIEDWRVLTVRIVGIDIHRDMRALRTTTAARVNMAVRWFVLVCIVTFTIDIWINFIEFTEMLTDTHVVVFIGLVEFSRLSAVVGSKVTRVLRDG